MSSGVKVPDPRDPLAERVKEVHQRIQQEIPHGVIVIPWYTAYWLVNFTSEYVGDHVEIGTMWGGSAILTAMFKPVGKIYTIDPLTENAYYGSSDWDGERPTVVDLQENIEYFGLSNRIVHVNAWSDPFPLKDQFFDTAFIDGDHTFKGAMADFINLHDRVNFHILFDDLDDRHLPVVNAFEAAQRFSSKWREELRGQHIGVLTHAGT